MLFLLLALYLPGPIPATFSNLSLETLDLSNNKLGGDIPADLGNALKLATVNLANNRLTGTFPKSLWNARTILLSNNLLTTLPSGHLPEPIGSVQELNIASNQLSGNGKNIVTLSRIQSFVGFVHRVNVMASFVLKFIQEL